MYGSEKNVVEKNLLKRIAYKLFGEVHVAGRIRGEHVIRVIAKIKHFHSRSISVFDAGTGKGDLVFCLARKYSHWRITGLELVEEKTRLATEAAKALNLQNLQFISGEITRMEFREQFDLVTCTDVLEHIDDDALALARLKSSLKRGGILILTFPAIPQRRHLQIVERKQKAMDFDRSCFGHKRDGYSIDEITQMLGKAGLEEIRCVQTFGWFGTLAYDLFFFIGDNNPNALVYLLFLPLFMVLGFLEVSLPIKKGSGLMVISKRPE